MAFIKKKGFAFFFSLVSFAICCSYFYLTPHLSILGFKSAIEKKDYQRARKYIHFNSVRQSIKSQLLPALQQEAERRVSEDPFGEIKIIVLKPILKAVVDRIVDLTVTPHGMELLLKTGQLTERVGSDGRKINANDTRIANKELQVSLYYKNLNEFVLSSKTVGNRGTVNAYWERSSFINWRLYSIDLPSRTVLSVK